MNRIYCALGKIVEVTQNIELELGEVCEKSEIIKEFGRHAKITLADYNQVCEDADYLKNKMLTMTFGQLIGVVYESKSLSYEEIADLKKLLEKRNYFTHEYFKYTKFAGQSEPYIVEEFEAIKSDLIKLKQMLNRLNMIKDGQSSRINYLLAKSGL